MVGKTISVRLDTKTYKKLEEIKKARGINESDAIRRSIMNAVIIPTGNVEQLSQEFCKIRILLEQKEIDEELRKEVKKVCQSIGVVLQRAENLITSPNA